MKVQEKEDNCFEIIPDTSFGADQESNFKEMLEGILKNKPTNIFINLTKLEYIDSTALGLMVLAKRESNAQNCAVTLIKPKDDNVLSILKITKFDEIFPMKDAI
jgi:anti-anti-sigma factor